MLKRFVLCVFTVTCSFADAMESSKEFPVYQTRYASSAKSGSSAAAITTTININAADVSALTQLKGIGVKKAEAIIEWRKKYGPFKSVDDLVQVKGIGQVILESNRAKLSVSS